MGPIGVLYDFVIVSENVFLWNKFNLKVFKKATVLLPVIKITCKKERLSSLKLRAKKHLFNGNFYYKNV